MDRITFHRVEGTGATKRITQDTYCTVYKPQKMAIIKKKTKITIQSAAVSFLLLGFQVFMGVKFACPCRFLWNQIIALLIVIVPAFFAGLMMHLFLRFQKQNNSGWSEGQDNTGRSKSGKKLHCMIRLIPSLLWLCIFFIDGDYVACGLTNWNGHYTCDTDVHPNCVSWCKPESNQGTNNTGKYISTQEKINISKVNTKYFYPTLFLSFVREG